jgi:hypothetical protein
MYKEKLTRVRAYAGSEVHTAVILFTCNYVQLGKRPPMFRRDVSPPSSANYVCLLSVSCLSLFFDVEDGNVS